MFEIIEKEYQLDMNKVESMFETAMKTFILNGDYAFAVSEAVDDEAFENIITEASNKFIEKTKQVLQNIKNAIEKFIRKAKEAFIIQAKKMQINKQLKQLKTIEEKKMKEFEEKYNVKVDKSVKKNIKKSRNEMLKEFKSILALLMEFQIKVVNADSDDKLDDTIETYTRNINERFSDFEDLMKTYIKTFPENGKVVIDELNDEYGSVDASINYIKNECNKVIDATIKQATKVETDEVPNTKKISVLKNIASNASSISTKCINAILKHPIMIAGVVTGLAGATVAVVNNKKNK